MGRKKSATSEMDVQQKMNTPLARALRTLISEKENAKELGRYLNVSSQAISQYQNGDARPSLDNICKIADFYHVSVDYLLGRSDIKSPNPKVQDTIELTGLSESTIGTLNFFKQFEQHDYANAIDELVSDCRYHNYDNSNNRDFRPILGLISYFLNYRNSGTQKIVYENGMIHDRPHPNRIPTNAIALNDIVIENAVLAEIQQALTNLKKTKREENHNGND